MPLHENPRPSNFQEKLEHFRRGKSDPDVAASYYAATNQLRNVLDGSDTEGIHAKYYPGWSHQDIEGLLIELGESLT